MGKKKDFSCCGGNDDSPKEHTMDCARPGVCFACGKKLKGQSHLVDTRDDQTVFVGPECFKHVLKAPPAGYQPPRGGPRLWPLKKDS